MDTKKSEVLQNRPAKKAKDVRLLFLCFISFGFPGYKNSHKEEEIYILCNTPPVILAYVMQKHKVMPRNLPVISYVYLWTVIL